MWSLSHIIAIRFCLNVYSIFTFYCDMQITTGQMMFTLLYFVGRPEKFLIIGIISKESSNEVHLQNGWPIMEQGVQFFSQVHCKCGKNCLVTVLTVCGTNSP